MNNDALPAELRQRVSKSGRLFRQLGEETMQIGLAGQAKTRRMPKLVTHAVGIKSAYRGMSLNQLYDRLEANSRLEVAEE